MKTMVFRYFLFAIVFILALSFVRTTHAHGGEPRLEISAERMNPGGIVDVRGVDFEFEEVVTLMLVNSQTVIPFGEVVADTEGVFLQTITLPLDLPEGTYNFLAITDDHNITSPDLTVQGPAIVADGEGGGQGPRDDDDPLLAPMPTFAPAVPIVSVPQEPVAGTPAVDWNPNVLVLVVLLVLGIIVVFGLKRKNTQ